MQYDGQIRHVRAKGKREYMGTTDRADEENASVKEAAKERAKRGKKKRRRTIDKTKVAENKRKIKESLI